MTTEGLIYREIERDALEVRRRNPQLDGFDATTLVISDAFIRMFDDFIEDVLQIKYSDDQIYKAETTIHEFVMRRTPMMLLITDLGMAIAKKYPNVARTFFADRVEWFKNEIKNIGMSGDVKLVYDLQFEFHMFNRLVEGGVITGQLEQALKTFEGLSPDVGRLYMSGLKALGSKAKTGRKVFDSIVQLGSSVPRTIKELSVETGKSKTSIRKGIDEILDNAGHLIRMSQRGQYEVYWIPEEIRRLHFV